MATDLAVAIEDRPGALAELGEAMGKAGLNVDGVMCAASGGTATLHLLVEDAAAAKQALEGAGLSVQGEREVLVVQVKDEPGVLGATARKLADAGVNIELIYLATNTRLVLGADDLAKARSALG